MKGDTPSKVDLQHVETAVSSVRCKLKLSCNFLSNQSPCSPPFFSRSKIAPYGTEKSIRNKMSLTTCDRGLSSPGVLEMGECDIVPMIADVPVDCSWVPQIAAFVGGTA